MCFQLPAGPGCHNKGESGGLTHTLLLLQAGEGSWLPLPTGPADTMTPGEGRERMEMSASPTYHYLIPLHDAEWKWRLSSSPAPPVTPPVGGIRTLMASTRKEMEEQFSIQPPNTISAKDSEHCLLLLGRKGRLPLSLAPPRGVRVLSTSVKWRELMGDGMEAQFLVQPC